ncbi:type II toxin-antitoxin system PemK/MazF family toxin [Shinella sp. NM-101]|uniref:type II toxin-antitoxin system PemK/MazF family toxin n=1 Tax=Shinella sp. NM-101 TaxID=2744455 RepID=UPI0021073555|nr:type II toxin-antitoxin system PemK/MazF family toxin [Shinella sp. NM-101]
MGGSAEGLERLRVYGAARPVRYPSCRDGGRRRQVCTSPRLRIPVEPSAGNGLGKPSQVMVDKAMTIRRDKIGKVTGTLDTETMASVTRSLALFLGFALTVTAARRSLRRSP